MSKLTIRRLARQAAALSLAATATLIMACAPDPDIQAAKQRCHAAGKQVEPLISQWDGSVTAFRCVDKASDGYDR